MRPRTICRAEPISSDRNVPSTPPPRTSAAIILRIPGAFAGCACPKHDFSDAPLCSARSGLPLACKRHGVLSTTFSPTLTEIWGQHRVVLIPWNRSKVRISEFSTARSPHVPSSLERREAVGGSEIQAEDSGRRVVTPADRQPPVEIASFACCVRVVSDVRRLHPPLSPQPRRYPGKRRNLRMGFVYRVVSCVMCPCRVLVSSVCVSRLSWVAAFE